jgi:hypothetical protein
MMMRHIACPEREKVTPSSNGEKVTRISNGLWCTDDRSGIKKRKKKKKN